MDAGAARDRRACPINRYLDQQKAGDAIAAAFKMKYPDAKPDQIDAERGRLTRAPLVVAVVSRAGPHVKIPEWEQVLSAGAAAMNLMLAAHALGYGASWITEWYAYDRSVLDALGLEPHERIVGFVQDILGRKARRDFGKRRTRPILRNAGRVLRLVRRADCRCRHRRHDLRRLALQRARLPRPDLAQPDIDTRIERSGSAACRVHDDTPSSQGLAPCRDSPNAMRNANPTFIEG